MQYFVGIEGVGMRQSVAAICNESGEILSAIRLPEAISLHTIRHSLLRERIIRLLKALCENLPASAAFHHPLECLKNARLCIGLTGVTFESDAIELSREVEALNLFNTEPVCTGDTEIIFASHAQGFRGSVQPCTEGGVITCTMGSRAYIACSDHPIWIGGWGPAIGDEGSGYWMGREALRAVAQEHDQGVGTSDLWDEIVNWLNAPTISLPEWEEGSLLWKLRSAEVMEHELPNRTTLFQFAHELQLQSVSMWRAIASGLTIPLMKAYRKNNPAAVRIVRRAVVHLANQFKSAFERHHKLCPDHSSLIANGPIVLYGGVLSNHTQFREILINQLRKRFKNEFVTVSTPGTMRPVCGALLYALSPSSTGKLCLPDTQVIERLTESQKKWLHPGGGLANE